MSNPLSASLADGAVTNLAGESPPSFFRSRFWRRFSRHQLAVVGALIMLLLVLVALTASVISPHNPYKTNARNLRQPPTATHWLGTDEVGRDVLSRLFYGARVSLSFGILTAILTTSIGTLLGLISGMYGGRVDFWLMRFTEVIMNIPTLIIVITLVAIIGPNIFTSMLVVGLVSWTGIARLVRGEILSLRERDFVLAARSIGVPQRVIVFRHMLPNVFAPITVAATFAVAGAILLEAGLSFLGLGVEIPTATWGNMLTKAQSLTVLEDMPWLWVPPGMMITITVLSINFIGDALRDALDPRLTNSR